MLIDDIIKSLWEYKTKGVHTKLKVEMFAPPTNQVQQGIEAEATRLGRFLDTTVALEYSPIK